MKIKSPLSFIHKTGLTEFSIEKVNGAYILKAMRFKQIIKKSEYDTIMANRVQDEVQADAAPAEDNAAVSPDNKDPEQVSDVVATKKSKRGRRQ